ncbi:hypothetical protein HGRIS_010972 [Hohenbuehelia grisea]|uniref:Uncharacterized protein n=1 Tax=Hohenbuehelia grisea TaxID=104357 RepID=A0ABR3IYV4_9AGAR
MEKLLAILRICSEEELADLDLEGEARAGMSQEEIDQRRQQIKNKILGVGRMQRVFQLLQEESENTMDLLPMDDATGIAALGYWISPDVLGSAYP